MQESAYVSQSMVELYTATKVLEVKEDITMLPNSFWALSLQVCKEVKGSVEFFIFNDGKPSMDVIFRVSGKKEFSIAEDVKRAAQTVGVFLSESGCRVSEKTNNAIFQFLPELEKHPNYTLCVPTERFRNISFCYTPGGYDISPQMDLKKIWNIVATNKNSGISIQCNVTEMREPEKQYLQKNIDWLYGLQNNNEVNRAKSIYNYFEHLSRRTVFFFNLSFWGQSFSISQIKESLGNNKYDYLKIPYTEHLDYYTDGHFKLCELASVRGHSIDTSQLTRAGWRFNFLTDVDTILRILGMEKPVDSWSSEPMSIFPQAKGSDSRIGIDFPKGRECVLLPFGERYFDSLVLGKKVDTDSYIGIPWNALSKHMVIAGMPGCGKTTMLFHIIHEAWKKNLPFILIEPTKTEYRSLINIFPDLKVYTPGRTDVSPMSFNPFLPPKGITLEQFLPSLESAFQLAFMLTPPLNVIFPEVIRNCYVKYGWRDDSTSDSPEVKIFGLHEFICSFKEEVQNSAYDTESKQNLLAGGVYRLQALSNKNSYLFDTMKSIDAEELLRGHTLIELDAVDNEETRALILNLLLLQLKLIIRKNQNKDEMLKNLIIIDEAHVLLGTSTKNHISNSETISAKLNEFIEDMIRVNRAYGTGMILADQSLSVLKPFFDLTDIKLVMRLEALEERTILSNSLSDGREVVMNMPTLKRGEFYLVSEETGYPIKAQSFATKDELGLKNDISDSILHEKMNPIYEKPFVECPCKKNCDLQVRKEAEYIARTICMKRSTILSSKDRVEEYLERDMDEDIRQMTEDFDNEKKLLKCARVMLKRAIMQKVTCSMKEI